jgi:hypothetical protein
MVAELCIVTPDEAPYNHYSTIHQPQKLVSHSGQLVTHLSCVSDSSIDMAQ